MQLIIYILSTAILLIVYWALTEYFPHYHRKKGENQAQMEDSAKIEYESEKGKNLATKEDIAEITKMIEDVKTSVSFEGQRRHNLVEERKNSLLNVLYSVEKIQSLQAMAYFAMYSSSPVDKLYTIMSDIQNTKLQLAHECRMVMISYPDKKELGALTKLVEVTNSYAVEICVEISNFASKYSEKESLLDMYMSMRDRPSDVLRKAVEAGDMANSIRDNLKFEHKEEVVERSTDYVVFLSKLYRTDIIVKG